MKTRSSALAVRVVNRVIVGALLVWIGSLHPSLAASSDAALERAASGTLAVDGTVAQFQRTGPTKPTGSGASNELSGGQKTVPAGCAQRYNPTRCCCGSGAQVQCFPGVCDVTDGPGNKLKAPR